MKGSTLDVFRLGLCVLFVISTTAWGATYKHLGCWMDTTADPDLSGQDSTPEKVDAATCSKYCQDAGYAYMGFKGGKKCLCDNRYARHGVSNTCNYTCDSNALLCGGPVANDVYYAVDADIITRAKRAFYGFKGAKTYFEARKSCVKADGDLVVMRDPSYFNSLQTIANASGITSDLVWIGIFWNKNNRFSWTDPSITGLTVATDSPYWRDSNNLVHDCVLLSLSGKDWITASCAGQYPYICFQKPPKSDEVTQAPDETEFVEEAKKLSFWEDKTKITFYLVLPLFVLCYGGSCLLYAISKCWRYFRRRKRQNARDSMMASSSEFEPDTKPLTQSDSRPLTSRDVKVEEGYTPPPPYYRVNSRQSKNRSPEERPTQTPVKAFRADEEEEVKPRPASRTASRRSDLLENAYSEAKERRRRETPEPGARPRSSRSPRPPALDPPAIPPPPMQSPKPPRRSEQYKEPVASPPPSDPAEPEIDYTKLSISDIMYIRGLMSNSGEKKKRKKPKKIIVA